MFRGSVKSVNLCETSCHTEICSYSFSNVRIHVYYYSVLVAVKEYERVEGWEGSNAVSPPRDGAAWILRNSTF